MKRCLLIAMMMLSAAVAHAGLVVWGNGFMLTVQNPAGWVASSNAGRADGLPVVLFEKGSTWQNSPVVMYARVVKSALDLSSFIAADVRDFQKSCPGIRVVDLASDEKRFICSAGNAPNSEVVHYARTKPGILIWVMSARTESQLESFASDFHKVVASATCDTMDIPKSH